MPSSAPRPAADPAAPAASTAAAVEQRRVEPARPVKEEPRVRFDPDEIAAAVYDDSTTFVGNLDDDDDPAAKPASRTGLLLGLMALALAALAAFVIYDKFGGSGADAPLAPTHGSFTITSRPAAARIFIDDVDTGQTAPHTLQNMTAGTTYRVHAELPGFLPAPSTSIQAVAGETVDVQLELQPIPHAVRIETTPPGARVIVDGREQPETTPTTLGPLEIDYRTGIDIILQLDGYERHSVRHTWPAGERDGRMSVQLTPEPRGGRRR